MCTRRRDNYYHMTLASTATLQLPAASVPKVSAYRPAVHALQSATSSASSRESPAVVSVSARYVPALQAVHPSSQRFTPLSPA